MVCPNQDYFDENQSDEEQNASIKTTYLDDHSLQLQVEQSNISSSVKTSNQKNKRRKTLSGASSNPGSGKISRNENINEGHTDNEDDNLNNVGSSSSSSSSSSSMTTRRRRTLLL